METLLDHVHPDDRHVVRERVQWARDTSPAAATSTGCCGRTEQ